VCDGPSVHYDVLQRCARGHSNLHVLACCWPHIADTVKITILSGKTNFDISHIFIGAFRSLCVSKLLLYNEDTAARVMSNKFRGKLHVSAAMAIIIFLRVNQHACNGNVTKQYEIINNTI